MAVCACIEAIARGRMCFDERFIGCFLKIRGWVFYLVDVLIWNVRKESENRKPAEGFPLDAMLFSFLFFALSNQLRLGLSCRLPA